MNNNRNILSTYSLFVVFFVWPFLSLFYAVKNFHIKKYRLIIILFTGFFGFTFYVRGTSTDIYRHSLKFIEVSQDPINSFYISFLQFLSLENENIDLFSSFLYSFVGLFTSDPRFFLMFSALIYGFLFVKTIGLVYDEFNQSRNNYSIFFILFGSLIIFIYNFQFIRFWHAAWLYILCVYQVIIYGKRKYILLSLLGPLIHFGFVIPTLLLILFSLVSRYKVLVYASILFLVLFSQYFLSQTISFASELGSGVESKVNSYNADAYKLRMDNFEKKGLTQVNWYVGTNNVVTYYYLFGVLIISIFYYKFKRDVQQQRLLEFIVLFFIVFWIIKQAGFYAIGRFDRILAVLVCFYLSRSFSLNKFQNPKWVLKLGVLVFFFYSIVNYRGNSEYISVYNFITNPIIAFFLEDNTAMQDVLF